MLSFKPSFQLQTLTSYALVKCLIKVEETSRAAVAPADSVTASSNFPPWSPTSCSALLIYAQCCRRGVSTSLIPRHTLDGRRNSCLALILPASQLVIIKRRAISATSPTVPAHAKRLVLCILQFTDALLHQACSWFILNQRCRRAGLQVHRFLHRLVRRD